MSGRVYATAKKLGMTDEEIERMKAAGKMTEAERKASEARFAKAIHDGDLSKVFADIFAGIFGGQDHSGTSTRKGRGLERATLALRDVILEILGSDAGPWTVRQLFYAAPCAARWRKSEVGYRQAQRQVLLMRREGLIDYSVIADNTRWMRKPSTFDSLDARGQELHAQPAPGLCGAIAIPGSRSGARTTPWPVCYST